MRRLLLGAVILTMLLAGCGDSGNDYDPTSDSERELFFTMCTEVGAVWERTYSGCSDAWYRYGDLLSYMDKQFSKKQWKYDCVKNVAMKVAEIDVPKRSSLNTAKDEVRECQGAPSGYCPWDNEVGGATCRKW
jgi:hypothetical protein